MSSEPKESPNTTEFQKRSAQANQSRQHGAGSSSNSNRASLSAAATSFTPAHAAGTTSAASSSPAGVVAAGHGKPATGGRGGGGRGRGRGSLSRELQDSGSHVASHRQHQQQQHQGTSGQGSYGGGRSYDGSEGHGGGARHHSGLHHPGEVSFGTSPGRRGITANHLLKFQTRRDSERQGGAGGRGSRGNSGRTGPPRRPAPKPQPYDRNKFLQANFRFLVSDAVDARRFESDPDRMLEWEDVVQVEMLSSAPVRCPITLDDRPFCPQITPCGHVFSFPAIIGHLVAHGGPELRKSAPCPLCYTQIAARELRLVQVHRAAAPAVGQVATFQLLRRSKDSINPEPVWAPMGSPTQSSNPGMGAEELGLLGAANTPGDAGAAAASPRQTGTSGQPQQPAGPGASGGTPGTSVKHVWSASSTHSGRRGGGIRPVGDGIVGVAGAAAGGGADACPSPPSEAPLGSGTACNRFSKFTLVSGPAATALWVAEAQRLAAHAAQVTAEGGLEAAYEAPNIYSAIDALASRARVTTERRHRLLLEAADPMAQDVLLSPEEAGQQAAAAVKGATTAALTAAAAAREQQAAAAARDRQFPSLVAATPPSVAYRAAALATAPPSVVPARVPGPVPAGSPGSATAAAAAAAGFEAAFSDDEAAGEEHGTATGAGQTGAQTGSEAGQGPTLQQPGQPRTAALPISPAAATATAGAGSGGASPSAATPVAGSAGAVPELSSSVKSAGGLLGSSPAETGGGGSGSDFYFYQAADGQWLFLCPLNLRMLLARYGSYAACPITISAKVLEVGDVAQDEASRRRMRVLAHLPLTATFKLCEVDLSGLLPPEVLAPFADELAQREKKRAQRAKQEARRLRQERAAAAAAAAAAAKTILSAAELRAMPLPSASLLPSGMDPHALEDAAVAVAVPPVVGEEHAGEEPGSEAQPAPSQPSVSFAAIARDGFAATGPSLSIQEAPARVAGPPAPASGTPKGAWGPKPAVPAATPAWGPAGKAVAAAHEEAPALQQLGGLQIGSSGGKGGKKKVLLFGGSQRKY